MAWAIAIAGRLPEAPHTDSKKVAHTFFDLAADRSRAGLYDQCNRRRRLGLGGNRKNNSRGGHEYGRQEQFKPA
ncbi:MAG: hypothetical protein WA854_18850 [Candidatus Binataceae bacterium]